MTEDKRDVSMFQLKADFERKIALGITHLKYENFVRNGVGYDMNFYLIHVIP